MVETKKEEILTFLNKIESDQSYKQILKFFQGVPAIVIAFIISMPSIPEFRHLITSLWEENKIMINGSDYNNLMKGLLKNDRSFWFIAIKTNKNYTKNLSL